MFPGSEFNNDVTSPDRLALRRGRTDWVSQPWAFREFRGLRLWRRILQTNLTKNVLKFFELDFLTA
jgi:hypothetical protein